MRTPANRNKREVTFTRHVFVIDHGHDRDANQHWAARAAVKTLMHKLQLLRTGNVRDEPQL